MGKDKIIPQRLGKLFFEIYRYTVPINDRIIKSLKGFGNKNNLPSDEKIMAELHYLYIYSMYNAFFIRFKTYYDIFKKNFREEYGNYLREMMSEESAKEYEMGLLGALSGYMEKHNETLAKESSTEKQVEFGRYISNRVIGEDQGDDIRYIMFLYRMYISNLNEFLRIIDTSIEIIE